MDTLNTATILDQRALTTLATLYTVPASSTLMQIAVSFANKSTTVASTVAIYLVAPAGTAGSGGNCYLPPMLVPAEQSVTVMVEHNLAVGWTIQAVATSVVDAITSGLILI